MKDKINAEIDKFLDENSTLKSHYSVIKDYINIGGKRLRPISCVMAYEALGGKSEDIFLPAIGLEFFHNSTLCHDDIMDEDATRRGKDSCHKAFQKQFLSLNKEKEYSGDIFSKDSMRLGVSEAIIAGNVFNFLGYKAFLSNSFSDELTNKSSARITEVMREVNHGQVLDMQLEGKDASEEEYLSMIGKKTATLLGGSFEIGAILAGASDEISKAFFDFGFSLGMAFQITDDLMDVDHFSKKGNTFGSDISKGKNTILMIKAHEKVKDIDTTDVEKDVSIFESSGAISYAKELAKSRVEFAKESLDKIDMDEEYKAYFLETADFVVRRKS